MWVRGRGAGRGVALLCALSAMGAGPAAAEDGEPAIEPCASVASAADAPTGALRTGILCHVNVERAERGLAPLRLHRELHRAAQRHSLAMSDEGWFSHTSPDGGTLTDRVAATDYLGTFPRFSLGEAIGFATPGFASPPQLVERFLRSARHRRLLLASRFTDLGVGIGRRLPARAGGGPGLTVTLVVGMRARL